MAYYKCGKIFATQNSNTSIETASGAIANFNTSLAMPVLDCNAEFSASQDLHGQSAPYPAGGGKNKANFVNGYGISTKGAVVESADRFVTVDKIPIKSGETYYVKKMQSDACSFIVAVYNGSTLVSRVSGLNSGDTIDTTGGDSFRVAGYASGSSVTFEAVEAMVVTDNTVTAYAPYSNICPIVGVDKVNIARTGKNLWNGTLINGDVPLDLKPNTTYTFSAKNIAPPQSAYLFVRRSSDGVNYDLVERIVNGTNEYTKTITTESGYIYSLWSNSNYSRVGDVQIEIGETATIYQPYNGTTALINLGGTYYGGSVDAVTGKIPQDHLINTFDGSENWSATDTHIFRLVTTGRNWLPISAANWKLGYLSNILRTDVRATGATSDKLPDHSFYITSQYLYIRFDEYDLAGMKAALGTTNLEICTPVSTPVTAQSSNTAELYTKAGLNNIYCDTGDIEVKYRRITQ